MSKTYVPLYRKYRPQTFADLIGQENIKQALSNAINFNRVSHAYLFCGPRGTGKTSTARIFAKSLNCVTGPTLEPCGECPSCIDVTNSNPVDVIEIDAASNRTVEDAQNILEKIQYVPLHGKYKIYIIDEVHMLSVTAFNALLKTLEEPPENVIFILATTESHKVLETIVSRCQCFDFRRITVDDIVKRLEYIAQKEEINITKEALFTIAKSVQGGMRDALALLDQLSILDVQKQIDVEDVENLLGKISVKILFELTEKIISNSPQEAVMEINKIYAKGNEPMQILSNLIEYFRNLLIIKTCDDVQTVLDLTKFSQDLLNMVEPQAMSMDLDTINYAIDRLATYLRETKNSSNRYLWLEVCVIELSNKLSNVALSDVIGRLESLEKAILGGVQITAVKPAVSPVVKPVISAPIEKTVVQPIEKRTEEKIENTVSQPVEKQDEKPMLNSVDGDFIADNKEEEKEIFVDTDIKPVETISEEETPSPQIQSSVVEDNRSNVALISENGLELWESLLANFKSLPSRAFFSSLSSPVKITPDKVVIGFTKDNFVSQSRDDAKMLPLKEAITGLFGHSDMPVEIVLISNEEAESLRATSKKKVVEPKQVVSFVQPEIVEDTSKNEILDEENDQSGYYEKQLEENQNSKKPKVYSDQAKMILELFNGKYLD